jgi:hypothetical protein
MKALVGEVDDRILGFTMIGAEAGEVIAAVQTAILAGLPYTGLRDAILTHPTMAEGLGSLFSNVCVGLYNRLHRGWLVEESDVVPSSTPARAFADLN